MALGKLDDVQDRRHAEFGQGRHPRTGRARSSAAGVRAGAAIEGAQGRRQAVCGHPPHRRRGSVAARPSPPGFQRDGHLGAWRDASACHRRASRRPQPDRRRGPCAGRSLPRDHPQVGLAARPPQEAVWRPWAVRRCGDRHQATAARQWVPVHRYDHRGRGAEDLHPVGRGRRSRLSEVGADGLSGRRRGGQPRPTAPTIRSTPPTWRSRWPPSSP